jgi:hypothetical protein
MGGSSKNSCLTVFFWIVVITVLVIATGPYMLIIVTIIGIVAVLINTSKKEKDAISNSYKPNRQTGSTPISTSIKEASSYQTMTSMDNQLQYEDKIKLKEKNENQHALISELSEAYRINPTKEGLQILTKIFIYSREFYKSGKYESKSLFDYIIEKAIEIDRIYNQDQGYKKTFNESEAIIFHIQRLKEGLPINIIISDYNNFRIATIQKTNVENHKVENEPETNQNQTYTVSKINLTPLVNTEINIESPKIPSNYDQSIIDVNSQTLDLSVDKQEKSTLKQYEIPYWSHFYVYSHTELNYATIEQKAFYKYFRKSFINGVNIDIQGNTNYAFILFYDLLNEYKNHKDIVLLENQLKRLGEICPRTKSYSLSQLNNILRQREDDYSKNRYDELQDPVYQFENGFSDYNPDLYKLGNQYKDKLALSKIEIAWLNKFYNPSNAFTAIEGCCIAVIRQYILIINELSKALKNKETTLTKEVSFFNSEYKRIYKEGSVAQGYNTEWMNYGNSYIDHQAETEIYLTIFKRVENSVRDTFGHKRKLTTEFTPINSKYLQDEFEERIGVLVNSLIIKHENKTIKPDISTQIELNAQNVNRWKIEFSNITENFVKEDLIHFNYTIDQLEMANKKNPNIEKIFFEAAKFIATYDKVQSLIYYAKYIYYDLKSSKFDNQQPTISVKKVLFNSEEQQNEYKKIIDELIKTKNIKTAIEKIPNIYVQKRKKIILDKTAINEIEQKHAGTVKLLTGYLENEDHSVLEKINQEEIEILLKRTTKPKSKFTAELKLNEVQEKLVEMIVKNAFSIHQKEVEQYAMKHGLFKNQLIDSINEICSSQLAGEALIEEDEESYVIEKSYYKEIVQ